MPPRNCTRGNLLAASCLGDPERRLHGYDILKQAFDEADLVILHRLLGARHASHAGNHRRGVDGMPASFRDPCLENVDRDRELAGFFGTTLVDDADDLVMRINYRASGHALC